MQAFKKKVKWNLIKKSILKIVTILCLLKKYSKDMPNANTVKLYGY